MNLGIMILNDSLRSGEPSSMAARPQADLIGGTQRKRSVNHGFTG